MATAAIAASAALPPERNTSRAARVALGCEVAAMPFAAIAADRPGILKSRINEPFAEILQSRRRHIARRSRPACPGLMPRPNLPVNSPAEKRLIYGRKPDTVAVSGCGAAAARGDLGDRPGCALAAHAAPLRARPHQFVAPRRRPGLDDRRYRLCDGANQGAVGANLCRAARRIAGHPGHRDALPSRPYRAGGLAHRALAGTLVGYRKGMAVRPGDEPRRRGFCPAAPQFCSSFGARPGIDRPL